MLNLLRIMQFKARFRYTSAGTNMLTPTVH